MEKKTSLYEEHVKANGKIVPFAGYLLPVQYKAGVITEHMAVREKVGVFDVSHMGEAILEGKDALTNLNYIMTNDFTDLKVGSCRYTLMLYPDGGQVDDLIVYRMSEEKFLLVLNASNTDKDVKWIQENLKGEYIFKNVSDHVAQIAIQGPETMGLMTQICKAEELPQKYYTFTEAMNVAGIDCLVSRTGYTGEFGYEIYMKKADAPNIWSALIKLGALPCGLGARDTLRLEAAMPLYGHELGQEIHVTSTNLPFAIKTAKEAFIGKEAVLNPPIDAPTRVGLKVVGRGIVRGEEPIFADEKEVGFTTSGTHCPFLGGAFAMGYLDPALAEVGTALAVEVRGRRVEVEVVSLPFYKK